MEQKQDESEYLPKWGNPLNETVYYKIDGTVFEIEASGGGEE